MRQLALLIFICLNLVAASIPSYADGMDDSCCEEISSSSSAITNQVAQECSEPDGNNSNCCETCPEEGSCCSRPPFSPGTISAYNALLLKPLSYAVIPLEILVVTDSADNKLVKPPKV